MAEAGSNGRGTESDAARLLLAAARERFAVAATELLLPDAARLTEWQRLTANQLLSRLLAGIEEDMRLRLLRHIPPESALHAALSSAHVAIAVPILERAGALTQTDLMMFLVRRVEEVEKTRGGIIIPDSAKERPLEGKVIAVGSGKRLEDGTLVKLDVQAGDRVLFGKYAGTEIKVDGVDHIIIREEEVLGVIES